jgi:short-subunit dehydrogenase
MSTSRGYALVTGAGQGIGRAIALELAREGFGLVVTARHAEALADVCREAGALNGGRAHAVAVDLLSPGAVDTLVAAVERQAQPLQVLVNNAGQGLWGLFDTLTLEEQHRMMRLNMDLPVMLTHRLLPGMKRQPQAYVLNIASMVAYHALASMAVYCGSKAFVLRWSRSLRLELATTGVKVQKFGTPPEPVAKEAVRAMLRGTAEVVPGLMNRITVGLQGLLPGALIERIASGIYLKRLPRKGAS